MTDFGYDDDGAIVPTVEPRFDDAEADEADELRGEFQEKLAAFLQWLISDGDATTAGRKAFLIAHLNGQSGCVTDSELARKLNISKGRLSQLRAEIAEDFESLERCNRRQD